LIIKLLFVIIVVEVIIVTHDQLRLIFLVKYLLRFDPFLEVHWLRLLRKRNTTSIFLLNWNWRRLALILNGLLCEKTWGLARVVAKIELRRDKLERVALRMLKRKLLRMKRIYLILAN
jgi:hypothetical protein